jgi:hypothetical protein
MFPILEATTPPINGTVVSNSDGTTTMEMHNQPGFMELHHADKVSGNIDNPPSSPLSSVISSAQSSTFLVKESDKQPDSATQPELSNPPPTTTESQVSKSDNVTAPELSLSKTVVDMATQTELLKEPNETTEVEVTESDDIDAPLSKSAADMTTQTELFKEPSGETTELEITCRTMSRRHNYPH